MGEVLKGEENQSVFQCVMWLQKWQLETGLGKCSEVHMALCAISLGVRSEATEHRPAVLTELTAPPVASHHDRGASQG